MNAIKNATIERQAIIGRLETNKDYLRLKEIDTFLAQIEAFSRGSAPGSDTEDSPAPKSKELRQPMQRVSIAPNVPPGQRAAFIFEKVKEVLETHANGGGVLPMSTKQLSMKLEKHGINAPWPSMYIRDFLRGSPVRHVKNEGWYWDKPLDKPVSKVSKAKTASKAASPKTTPKKKPQTLFEQAIKGKTKGVAA